MRLLDPIQEIVALSAARVRRTNLNGHEGTFSLLHVIVDDRHNQRTYAVRTANACMAAGQAYAGVERAFYRCC
jgi:hypothetical protein